MFLKKNISQILGNYYINGVYVYCMWLQREMSGGQMKDFTGVFEYYIIDEIILNKMFEWLFLESLFL